jgi:hypothetical protein
LRLIVSRTGAPWRDFVVEGFGEKEMDVLGHDDVAEDFAPAK